MKTKNILQLVLFSSLLAPMVSRADNVSMKTPELSGLVTFHGSNMKLTDWQAVMRCHFDYKGSRKESIRYPQTFMKDLGNEAYSISVKKGSLSEFLPTWRLLTCAYKLILIAKNTETGKNAFGEIYLAGQEHGEMDPEELKVMEDQTMLAEILKEKLHDLRVTVNSEGGIILE
jgi:hypothetical protein